MRRIEVSRLLSALCSVAFSSQFSLFSFGNTFNPFNPSNSSHHSNNNHRLCCSIALQSSIFNLQSYILYLNSQFLYAIAKENFTLVRSPLRLLRNHLSDSLTSCRSLARRHPWRQPSSGGFRTYSTISVALSLFNLQS